MVGHNWLGLGVLAMGVHITYALSGIVKLAFVVYHA